MMFRRKNRLRKQADSQLLNVLITTKEQWVQQKHVVDRSIDPSDNVLYELRLAEAKYLMLLREAKRRDITVRH